MINEDSWSDPTGVGLQATGPDGEPVFGKDVLARTTSNRIVEGYTQLEFLANWSGGVTGVIFGYRIDNGPVTWLPPPENGVPQLLDIPPNAFETPEGPYRWTLYWEPSTQHTPGTGGWVGPGSLNRYVHAVR